MEPWCVRGSTASALVLICLYALHAVVEFHSPKRHKRLIALPPCDPILRSQGSFRAAPTQCLPLPSVSEEILSAVQIRWRRLNAAMLRVVGITTRKWSPRALHAGSKRYNDLVPGPQAVRLRDYN